MKLSSVVTGLIFAAISRSQGLVDTLKSDPSYSTLLTLASSPGQEDIVATLSNVDYPLTVFAPTNQAFEDLKANNPELYEKVATTPELLNTVLKYHVIPEVAFTPTEATKIFVDTAAAGAPLAVEVSDMLDVTLSYGLAGSTKVQGSVKVGHTIVHQIGKVLIPPQSPIATLTSVQGFETLASIIEKVGFASTIDSLDGVTIFAPNDAAFAALIAFAEQNGVELTPNILTAVLSTHVVQGVVYSTDIIESQGPIEATSANDGLKLNVELKDGKVQIEAPGSSATVVLADVLIKGGVVHVIDAVLLPELATIPVENTTPSFGLEKRDQVVSGAVSLKSGLVAVVGLVAAFAL